ncbi:hypothetical protein LTR09_011078 [Extremus antarcticus]|uniref:Uncharacterized protein n=1 Tax=Extremus antarcticus TaxID=702011 RepID=A0AAJ0DCP4_9PEZI|nr:hypothetical protein LTR09_011078 [Extremus antarcticus]
MAKKGTGAMCPDDVCQWTTLEVRCPYHPYPKDPPPKPSYAPLARPSYAAATSPSKNFALEGSYPPKDKMVLRKRPSLQGFHSKSQDDLETPQQSSYKSSGLRNEVFLSRSGTSSPHPGPLSHAVTQPTQRSAPSKPKPPSAPWNQVNLEVFRDPNIPDETMEEYINAATKAKCMSIVARDYFKYLWKIIQPDSAALESLAAQLNPEFEDLSSHLAGEGIVVKAKQSQSKLKVIEKGSKMRDLGPTKQKEAISGPKCPICDKTGHTIHTCNEFLSTSKEPEHSKSKQSELSKSKEPEHTKLTEPEHSKSKRPEQSKPKGSQHSKPKEAQHSKPKEPKHFKPKEPEQPSKITESSVSGQSRTPSRQ